MKNPTLLEPHLIAHNDYYEAWVTKLSQINPDEYWVAYWAIPLSLLGGPDEVSIAFDKLEEPSLITITITPDYGS